MPTSSESSGLLALIPARGGSKRLPGKNVRNLAGKPLIAWTIEAAIQCGRFSEIVVSTDDPEIAAVSERYGARVPFLRPHELASDTSTTFEAVKHVLDRYRIDYGREFGHTVLLQPTSPLRDAHEIESALDLLAERSADAVISVCEMEHSPLWANTLPPDLSLAGFLGQAATRRSQDLPTYYRINGAIYASRTNRLLLERTFFLSDKIYAHIMPKSKSIDIDDEFDFLVASALAQAATGNF